MLNSFQNIFKIPELRNRVIFTLSILVVYRIGAHIPVPGIDSAAMGEFMRQQASTLFGLFDMFVGGALAKASIFALGIMPYISASIILQLFTAVFPYFERLKKEGPEGQKKITQYTRYGTVGLSALQAWGMAVFIESMNSAGLNVVPEPGWGFRLLTTLTLTAGTVFVMWLGEQISERGIGNGISLLIFIGIVATFPQGVLESVEYFRQGLMSLFQVILLVVLAVLVTAAVIYITQGQRKIPVQYAKQFRGRKVYGGQSTHIPLRVNTAGVIPIIFAQSLIMFPSTMAAVFRVEWMRVVESWFAPGAPLYLIVYSLLIIFFAYFYTAIIFNPVDLADNMKRYGGFIPGIRPGKRTSDYIDRVLTRITLPGAIFLALISIFPYFLIQSIHAPQLLSYNLGGTGLLIVVGVGLDTLQQIETHLLMRHYDGFMKKGKIRGRIGRG
ncbi:MAG: preprotein translocase subunit SecY [Gemmatimonadetes bacterium]|nr:MAG: preprotein translocase subunit SecY [Gemmatimonadota bacterium]